ncbi:hypothetical protein A3709_20495 [Halioglobus sp. HI00S01]|uniref:hypothetical protein n=1 Tax=Halioglobus sp. HI00S01 TaxID=1822214 RepID=UPI0007C37624|nr:hypothetical protein [Halioglobus sp. HI00S01]KZX57993.1 hypothetical protein A3709_20495 [Halioglobus sp. HI00S01]
MSGTKGFFAALGDFLASKQSEGVEIVAETAGDGQMRLSIRLRGVTVSNTDGDEVCALKQNLISGLSLVDSAESLDANAATIMESFVSVTEESQSTLDSVLEAFALKSSETSAAAKKKGIQKAEEVATNLQKSLDSAKKTTAKKPPAKKDGDGGAAEKGPVSDMFDDKGQAAGAAS